MNVTKLIEELPVDELAEQLIDLLNQANFEERKEAAEAFAGRADRDKRAACLWDAFLSQDDPRAYACIGHDVTLREAFAQEVDGVLYRRTVDIGKAVLRREYRRELAKCEKSS